MIYEKNNSYTDYESQLPFRYSAKTKILSKHAKLLQDINFYDSCNDEQSYEKLQSAFKDLLEFMTIFINQINTDTYKLLLHKTQEISKLFAQHSQENKYLLIITMMLTYINKNEYPKEIAYLQKKKKQLLQQKRKFEQNIFENLEKFKNITF